VLTGGSAATYYVPEAYQSADIDFVLVFVADQSSAEAALAKTGFLRHPKEQYYTRNVVMVEFPRGPLALGSFILPADRHSVIRRGNKVLYVLTTTDAVCNRLESYYAWDDFSARVAAAAIVAAHRDTVDLHQVREWTLAEYRNFHMGQYEKFNDFIEDLERAGHPDLPLKIDPRELQ
jgi:hypothetical protein